MFVITRVALRFDDVKCVLLAYAWKNKGNNAPYNHGWSQGQDRTQDVINSEVRLGFHRAVRNHQRLQQTASAPRVSVRNLTGVRENTLDLYNRPTYGDNS